MTAIGAGDPIGIRGPSPSAAAIDAVRFMREAMQRATKRYLLMRKARPLKPEWWRPIKVEGVSFACGGAWQELRNGRWGPLRVIETIEVHEPAPHVLWHHVSASVVDRVPEWNEMARVKAQFIGTDREAYVVMPPAARYVNRHPFTLHLWSCLDAMPDGARLPDFRDAEGLI